MARVGDRLSALCALYTLILLRAFFGLILLRAFFGVPRVQHLLRCSSPVDHPSLVTLDDLRRSAINFQFKPQWHSLDPSYTFHQRLQSRHQGCFVLHWLLIFRPSLSPPRVSTVAVQKDHFSVSFAIQWETTFGSICSI